MRISDWSSDVCSSDLGARVSLDRYGADWYRRRGLPHRRGYLLSGPPGTGKSTLVRAVAGALDLDLCLIDLSAANLDDQRPLGLLAVAPNPGLLLIEDVDAAFSGRAAEGEAGGQNVRATRREGGGQYV